MVRGWFIRTEFWVKVAYYNKKIENCKHEYDFHFKMNFSFFISQRIRKPQKTTFSATVSRIGTVSIALGIAVGIVAFSILLGFKQTIKDKVFLLGAHLQISSFTLNQSLEENPIPHHTTIYDTLNPAITHRQVVAHKAGILKTTDELQGAILKGVGRDYDWAKFNEALMAGKPIVFSDTAYSNQIIVSNKIAKALKVGVGAEVIMYFVQNPPRARKLKVVGIYETHIEEFDNQLIIGDIALVQRLNDWDRNTVGSYEFYVKDLKNIKKILGDIKKQLPPEMRIESVIEKYPLLFDWLNLLDQNNLILMTLILFVACFNIISVLLVMMMERTSMIGLLKTLGSPDGQIRRIFFYVGLQLAIKGLLFGNMIGIGLCWIQQRFKIVPLEPSNYYMSYVPIQFDWTTVFLLNIFTILIIALILSIPTLIISKVQPIRALGFRK